MIFFVQAAMDAAARAALERETERRLAFATDRFDPQIRNIEVVLRDINGPQGGVDKVCHLTAKLRRGGSVEVQEQSSSFVAAIGRAFRRLQQSLARRLGGKASRSAIRYERVRKTKGGMS